MRNCEGIPVYQYNYITLDIAAGPRAKIEDRLRKIPRSGCRLDLGKLVAQSPVDIVNDVGENGFGIDSDVEVGRIEEVILVVAGTGLAEHAADDLLDLDLRLH